jgi:hypothetical protein
MMNTAEFDDAVRKGLGRCVIYLRDHGDAAVRDSLLNHCLNCTVWDQQADMHSTEWLLSLISHSDDPDFYFQAIVQSVNEPGDDWSMVQRISLCGALGQQGNGYAREAVYRYFDRQIHNEEWLGGVEIVLMDGLPGLEHVARLLGRRLREDPDYWVGDLSEFECEVPAVPQMLEQLCDSRDPDVQRFLQELEPSDELASGPPPFRAPRDLGSILAAIEDCSFEYAGHFTMFGRIASNSERAAV